MPEPLPPYFWRHRSDSASAPKTPSLSRPRLHAPSELSGNSNPTRGTLPPALPVKAVSAATTAKRKSNPMTESSGESNPMTAALPEAHPVNVVPAAGTARTSSTSQACGSRRRLGGDADGSGEKEGVNSKKVVSLSLSPLSSSFLFLFVVVSCFSRGRGNPRVQRPRERPSRKRTWKRRRCASGANAAVCRNSSTARGRRPPDHTLAIHTEASIRAAQVHAAVCNTPNSQVYYALRVLQQRQFSCGFAAGLIRPSRLLRQ
ncbi:hypothetical protein Taro_053038 [Colocasia esculenta]|uniref:Uncharacterized protein n=1 Tax=Colocasia esculenta TaxID=4460 RepID=A0A843XLE6_COLES|nr:hypothetical protein [Colocasia esculenta]